MHLLFGIGDADDAMEALDATVERARAVGDTLTVAVYDEEGAAEDIAASVRDRLATLEFEATVRTLDGEPGGQLVELADRDDVDRIVLPGGTRSPLGKIRLDRATEFVLLNANTTVTLIR